MSGGPSDLESVAAAALPRLGATALRTLADRIQEGWPEQAVLSGVGAEYTETARAVLDAQFAEGRSAEETAGFLRGLAAGYGRRAAEVAVEPVWSGPGTHPVPVRATARVLVELIERSNHELMLMTYSARPHRQLRRALRAAVDRGVVVTVVVETLRGARGALGGPEPAEAFTGIGGIELWHWPPEQRTERDSRTHAKIAVADRRELLVSSANLTQSGVDRNIEAGLRVRGGTAPARAAEHLTELRTRGILERLHPRAREDG
ncbi:DISARM system phospholipase D-like protein DrmC [Actinopolyspora mortivallis]|uniref:Endonuclease n=1 Tax=Actinopolyspora mortivallis TaxID=33906 RepID=A0A2T0H1I1_ACTMO|nr:DISARM system phospholipase D-like protein DrmC [Actinopolyspora mortivallis]PRW65234.1 endonuclease [Actinopolyspora mortivallis]